MLAMQPRGFNPLRWNCERSGMIWTIADDSGRSRAASRMLASLLYPYDEDAPRLIGGWLDELEAKGCIATARRLSTLQRRQGSRCGSRFCYNPKGAGPVGQPSPDTITPPSGLPRADPLVGGGVVVDMARRKPKLPLASAGRVPHLKISEGDWTRIEKGYGRQLPDQLRARIFETTQEFLSWAEFEHTAPPIAQAEGRIEAIKDATRDFVAAILSRPSNVTGTADFKAKQMICEYAGLPFEDGVDGLTRLAWKTAVLEIPKACDAALADLVEQRQAGGSFSDGAAWDGWVRKLTEAMTAQGLPTAARKDTDKRRGPSSPFVVFVHELQQCIPDRFRRSTQSRDALAQAIYGARVGGSGKSNPAP